MRSFKDIKKFEDIDTYYNILELVSEIFIDRVEAHKHLVSTNKEIERLNNIIDELVLECYNSSLGLGEFSRIWRIAFNEDYQPNKIDKLKELKGSDE